MPENRLKRYYGKMKELLGIVAVIITIIWGILAILSFVYIPNSVAFEVAKDLFLVMIPITVSMIVLQFALGDIRKTVGDIREKLETKPPIQTLPNLEQETSQLDRRMDKIETDIEIVKSYFTTRCPRCSYLMSLPVLSSMVQLLKIHEKDGPPTGLYGEPEYEIACSSCHTIWHIVC